MKYFSTITAVAALMSAEVSAHYIFQQFTYGGTTYPVGKFIRPNTNYNSPITEITDLNLRCNEGGASGANTETISVQAGQSFTFTSDVAVYHNGPIAIYMAKAPTTAAAFDGSGQVWFKIWEKGPTFSGNSVDWPLFLTYTATIPSALPNGEYLLRIEQLGLHNPYPAGIPQFYIECAQLSVTNGGSGVPGPLVSIPGHVVGNELSYTVNIYNQFSSYAMLGPPVWSAGGVAVPTSSGGSVSTVSKTTSVVGPTTTAAVTTTLRTTTTSVSRTTTSSATTTSAGGGGGSPPIAKWEKCGGERWTGGTNCVGSVCTYSTPFYSQCL